MDLQIVKENLEKKGFKVSVFSDAKEASDYLNKEINNTSVAFGGSMTLAEMGLFDTLKTHNELWYHSNAELIEKYGREEIFKRAMSADIYISSVNGMSSDGALINIDGNGNRIASTAFGHKKVYYVVGKNKIEDTFDKAMWRARNIAAPKNAQRLSRKTPCAIKGDKCYNCSSPERICRGILITETPMSGQETEILLINENLGY